MPRRQSRGGKKKRGAADSDQDGLQGDDAADPMAKYMSGVIAPDDDEDISDGELGWNSEDEAKYGVTGFGNMEDDLLAVENDSDDYVEEETEIAGIMTLSDLLDANTKQGDDSDAEQVDVKGHQSMVDNILGAYKKNTTRAEQLSDSDDSEAELNKYGRKEASAISMNEGAFNVGFNQQQGSSGQLTLDDLVSGAYAKPTKDSSSDEDSSSSGSDDGDVEMTGQSKVLQAKLAGLLGKNKATPAPVEEFFSAQMQRQEGSARANQKVARWDPFVSEMNAADKLKFPLNPAPRIAPTVSSLTAKFKPSGSLESDLNNVLEQFGYNEEARLAQAELDSLEKRGGLEAFRGDSDSDASDRELNRRMKKKLSEEQQKVIQMRSVLFFHEKTLKRRAKIKSKTYRKRWRAKLAREAALNAVSDDEETMLEDKKEAALLRIQERMSLNHKNTGKWARRQLKRGKNNDRIQELNAQRRVGQSLMARDSSEDEERSDDSDALYDRAQAQQRLRAQNADNSDDSDDLDNLTDAQLQAKLAVLDKALTDGPAKAESGLMGMKFMQRAQEQKQKQALAGLRREARLEKQRELELNGGAAAVAAAGQEAEESSSSEDSQPRKRGVLKVSLQEEPQAKAKAPRFQVQAFSDDEQEDDAAAAGTTAKPEDWVLKMERGLQKATLDENEDTSSDDEDVTMKQSTSSSRAQQNKDWKRSTGQKRKQPTADASSSDEDDAPGKENPWAVSMANNPRKILQRKNETETAKEVVKAGLKASKHIDKKAKREGRNQPTKLDMQKTLLRTVGSDNEAEADVDLLGGSKSNAQMIRDAFMSSTDKQEAEKFRLEKEAAIADKLAAEDHEQLRVKTAVAGWGSWGGLGVQPKKKSRRQRMKEAAQKKRVEKKRNAIIMRRKDARLENVIISERENKRQALKYHVPTVPYPFTSKQQFEAAQRHPLGSEWNTQDKYKAFIEPRIQVQHGALIEPAKFDKTQQMDLKKKRNARRKISAQAGKYEKK